MIATAIKNKTNQTKHKESDSVCQHQNHSIVYLNQEINFFVIWQTPACPECNLWGLYFELFYE